MNNQLSAEIAELREASQGYKDIRHRFFEKVICDCLQRRPSSQRIDTGNHHGECRTDSLLYVEKDRQDVDVFLAIYGVEPPVIRRLELV